jgi:6-phosphogluconolactonase
MYRLVLSIVALLLMNFLTLGEAAAEVTRVYIGTFADGIYTFSLDTETGETGAVKLAASTKGPGFLALHPSRALIYAAGQNDEGSAVLAFARDTGTGMLTLINSASSEGRGACHVDVSPQGSHVAVANYSAGTMAVLPIRADGGVETASATDAYTGSGPNEARQKAPHAHAADFGPEGKTLYVTDLGTDRIHSYAYDSNAGTVAPMDPPAAMLAPGAGPRHFTIHADPRWAYVVNELDSTVTAFSRDETGRLESIQTIGTLPADIEEANTTAEIVVHPTGKFLYASNRGHDSIACFAIDVETGKLTAMGHTSTGGERPRNFNVDPSGRFLLAANQDTNNVVIFRIDEKTGVPEATGQSVEVPSPVCVVFVADVPEADVE